MKPQCFICNENGVLKTATMRSEDYYPLCVPCHRLYCKIYDIERDDDYIALHTIQPDDCL